MELKIRFEMNRDLKNAFRDRMQDFANGAMPEDKKEYIAMIGEIERKKEDDWSEETKQELANFILGEAGFQMWDGREASQFEARKGFEIQ